MNAELRDDMTRFATEDTGSRFVMGMLWGAAVGAAMGAAAGLLLAPESGAALRQRLGKSANRLRRSVGDEYTRAAEAVTSAVDDVIERGADALEHGQEAYRNTRRSAEASTLPG